jgi:hypothetical protein
MTILAFLIGIGLPTASGILLLALLERKHPVLYVFERIALGLILGTTYTMFLTFLAEITTKLPLNLFLFLGIQLITLAILIALTYKYNLGIKKVIFNYQFSIINSAVPSWLRNAFFVLLTLMIIKILMTSITFLFLVPTYLDDSLTNWNLRGKVFYYDQALTLVLPGDDPLTSPKGVSSYPPAVPMLKTWLSTLAGKWSDPLVNTIHILWYISALILVYSAIKRRCGREWACVGLLMIGGIPLYLMHGTNAYADIFLSVHVFAAVSMLFHALMTTHEEERMTFLRIGAMSTAILPFTKNEAMLVYLPPLILLTAIALFWYLRRTMTSKHLRDAVLWYLVPFLLVCVPWLLYKWLNGLTFGNGKEFTGLGFSWHENVLISIAINTFFEANWLLLFPLLIILLVWRWKQAFSSLSLLSVFFLIIYIGQMFLYLFTNLATEALRQTGYARGLIQLTPTVILLTVLLMRDAFPHLFRADRTVS